MLKNAIATVLVALSMTVYGQDMPKNEDGKFEYSEIINVDGATKEQLFRSTRSWFLENYSKKNQGDEVIYTDDSYLGEMAASPMLFLQVHVMGKSTGGGSVNYDIIVSCKEGKYKYTISQFYHESNRSMICSGGALELESPDCEEGNMNVEVWAEIKEQSKLQVEKLIAEFKEHMVAAATNSDGNW